MAHGVLWGLSGVGEAEGKKEGERERERSDWQ